MKTFQHGDKTYRSRDVYTLVRRLYGKNADADPTRLKPGWYAVGKQISTTGDYIQLDVPLIKDLTHN